MLVRFGAFAFDSDARSLLKRGQLVHLTPRAFKLLEILLEHRPRPVSRAELERQLWSDAQVAESNLPSIVLELRRTLEDQERCALIRTVYRVGYAFIGKARERKEDSPLKLGIFRALVHRREIGLVDGENWIGRATDCRVQVDCSLVSRRHACIVVEGHDATLKDGSSRNGTFLNSKRLASPATLYHRDEIRIGSIYLSFRIVHPDKATDAERV